MSWVKEVTVLLAWLPPPWVTAITAGLNWIDDLMPRSGYFWESLPVSLIMLVLGPPVILLLAECGWAILRWVVPDLGEGPRRAVMAALAAEMRRGGDPAASLLAQAPHLRRPWCHRAFDAGERVRAGHPVPDALVEHGLAPSVLLASGRAAWALGREALVDWCEQVAEEGGQRRMLHRPWAMAFWQVCGFALLFGFFATVIHPKMEQIRQDIAFPARFSLHMDAVAAMSRHGFMTVTCLVAVGMLVTVLLVRIGWRGVRRRQWGRYLLRASRLGRSEAMIASALAAAGLRSRSLAAAGAAGDFAAICRACGWSARDPDDLALAVDRDDRRRAWRRALLVMALGLLVPLLLAVPVTWFAMGMFGYILDMIEHLAP